MAQAQYEQSLRLENQGQSLQVRARIRDVAITCFALEALVLSSGTPSIVIPCYSQGHYNMYVYTYMHIYVHTYIHTYIYICGSIYLSITLKR